MRHARFAIAIALLVLPACGGPRSELVVGVKEIDTDVLIGPQGPTPDAVPPAQEPIVGFPGFIEPPITIPPPVTTPPPPACPVADPLSPVRNPAVTVASRPPVEHAYAFRNIGAYTVGDRRGAWPPVDTRTVRNVESPAADGGFRFDVAIDGPAGETTATTYRVFPEQDGTLSPPAGIYIEQVVTTRADGSAETFQPVPSLLLMPFPASIGATWDARGVDPFQQIVMQFSGRIDSRGTVDACGTLLEAWVVEITDGSIVGPRTDLSFDATLYVAPQYGGLIVRDKVVRTGTDVEGVVEISNTARITTEPEMPS